MGPLGYHISDDGGVITEVRSRGPQAMADFAELLDRLIVHPRDRGAGVLELKDDWPVAAFTAPFDDALLTYTIAVDFPVLQLRLVTWFG